jgi:hypothetical protein
MTYDVVPKAILVLAAARTLARAQGMQAVTTVT